MKGGRRCQFSGLCPSVVPPPPPPSPLLAILCHPTKYQLAGSKTLQKIFRFPLWCLSQFFITLAQTRTKVADTKTICHSGTGLCPLLQVLLIVLMKRFFSTSLCPWDLTSTLTRAKKLVIFVARTWQPSFCSFLPDGIHLGWLGW